MNTSAEVHHSKKQIEQLIQKQLGYVRKKLFNPVVPTYRSRINILRSLVNSLSDFCIAVEQDIQATSALTQDLTQIEHDFQQVIRYNGYTDWLSFQARLKQDKGDWPEWVELVQAEQRFSILDDDTLWVKTGKLVKKAKRSYEWAKLSLLNTWRTFRKKEPVAFRAWMHTVPVHAVWNEAVYIAFAKFIQRRSENYVQKVQQLSQIVHDLLTVLPTYSNGKTSVNELQSFKTRLSEIESELTHQLSQIPGLFGELKEYVNYELSKQYPLCGTFELSEKKLLKQAAQEEFTEKIEKKLAESQRKWQSQWKADVQFIAQIRELLSLKKQEQELSQFFRDEQQILYENNIHKGFALFVETCEKIIQNNDTSAISNKRISAFKEHLQSQLEQLQQVAKHIQEELLEGISAKNELILEAYELKQDEILSGLTERFRIFTRYSASTEKPESEFKSIDWQPLLKRIVLSSQSSTIDEIRTFWVELEDDLSEMLRSMIEIMETNVFSAVHKTDESDDEASEVTESAKEKKLMALDIVNGALNRSLSQWKTIAAEKKNGLLEILDESEQQLKETLRQLIEQWKTYSLDDLEAQRRSIEVRSKAINWKVRAEVLWAQTEDVSLKSISWLVSSSQKILSRAKELIYPTTKIDNKSNQQQLGTFLLELDKTFERLPYVYKKLFDYEGKADLRYQYRREEALSNFYDTLALWKNGNPQLVAIIGEKGSGRSFFTKKLTQELESQLPVYHINLQQSLTEPEVLFEQLSSVLQQDIKTIQDLKHYAKKTNGFCMVVDSFERLFLRKVDGFAALEQLLHLMNETADQVLWIVSSGRYTWNYLNVLYELEKNFGLELEMDTLTKEQVKEIVLKRHKLSGFRIRYEPDELIRKTRAYRKLQANETERQQYLEELFFTSIVEIAQGNIRIAMIQWLRSIQEVNELEMVLQVQTNLEIELPASLTASDYFTLAAIVLHAGLNSSQHAQLFNCLEMESQLQLSRLRLMNILEKTNDRYELNKFAYRSVISSLKRKNMLH